MQINPDPLKTVPLVTDMDGTLLKTDTLWEGCVYLLREKIWLFFAVLLALFRGRCVLKRFLAPYSTRFAAFYPENPLVIAELCKAVQEGRPVYLASAAHQSVAEAVSSRYPFFTGIFASNDSRNLKGKRKAALLISKFGKKQFDYIGDSQVDLPVWQAARTAIVASSDTSLLMKVRQANPDCRALSIPAPTITSYGKAFRVHQWVKNILVFVPLFLVHRFDFETFAVTFLAFLSFCCCASSIYIVNDLCDLASDRQHTVKRMRPFAAGTIPIAHGLCMSLGALGCALLLGMLLPRSFFICLIAYCALTTVYTLFLKRLLLLDVIALACLYDLRLAAGALAIDSDLSHWLLAFGLFIFLGLALFKRAGELNLLKAAGILPGRSYMPDDKDVMEMTGLCSGFASVVVAALYIDSLQALQLYTHPGILWGVCLVLIYWYGRIALMLRRGEMRDDPVDFAIRDKTSFACCIAILFFVFGAI